MPEAAINTKSANTETQNYAYTVANMKTEGGDRANRANFLYLTKLQEIEICQYQDQYQKCKWNEQSIDFYTLLEQLMDIETRSHEDQDIR